MNVFIIIVVALAIFTIFTVLEIYNNANRTEGFEDLENTLVFAMRDPLPRMQIPEIQIKAELLKQQQEIEFPEILSNLVTTNPIGSGII